MSDFDYQGLSYDILSIMHYGNYDFSNNGLPTIVAKNGMALLEAYYKTSLSDLDIIALKRAYSPCNYSICYVYKPFECKFLSWDKSFLSINISG